MRPTAIFASFALFALLLAACDRNVEPYVPGEVVEKPDLSKIFPEGADKAAADATAEAGGAPERGMPQPPAEEGAPIRGTVELAPELAGRVPDGAVLFLIARGGGGGPPLAAKRIPAPEFPYAFRLGPSDRMIKTLPFAGPMQLSVRLDGDGNATSRSPGDLQGQSDSAVAPGAEGVRILIDEVL